MNKRGLVLSVLLVFSVFAISFASALSYSTSNISSTEMQVDISNAVDIYSYEVNFDYTDADVVITQAAFLGEDSVAATYGYSVKDGILSVYGSRLDSSAQGISGSGNLFNITYTGNLTLRYSFSIQNDTAGLFNYYNASSSSSGGSSSSSGSGSTSSSSGGSSSGGGGSSGTTYVLELDSMQRGIEKKMAKDDGYRFPIVENGKRVDYKVVVKEIKDKSVEVELSNGKKVSLSYSALNRIDLNSDGIDDIILEAKKTEAGVDLFISGKVPPIEEKSVSVPSKEVIKGLGGTNVKVKEDVTYGSSYFDGMTAAVQDTTRSFFEGLWKSFVELFKL